MSWNVSALFVRDRTIDDVVNALPGMSSYTRADETVDWSVATAGTEGDRVSLAESGGWCQVWDPRFSVVPDVDESATALAGTTALSVMFSGVTDTYAFTVDENGTRVRMVCFSEGESVVEDGDELPVERRLPVPTDGPDEDYLWKLIAEFTGLELDDALEYTVYSRTDG